MNCCGDSSGMNTRENSGQEFTDQEDRECVSEPGLSMEKAAAPDLFGQKRTVDEVLVKAEGNRFSTDGEIIEHGNGNQTLCCFAGGFAEPNPLQLSSFSGSGSAKLETAKMETASGDGGRGGEEEETMTGGPRFDPPVYVQRYNLVHNVLKEHQVKSVVDFGSAECKIVRWLKEVGTLEQIFLVDIDGELLRSSTNLIKPLTFEYLVRRQRPLTITMLQGSAAQLDGRVAGSQAASLVEIIEHLEPDILPAVTDCVFGKLHPSLVIVTTPNADFNVFFPGLSGFRHWDHKFEWTRQEFQNWCQSVCDKYGYSVQYMGVGDPPEDMTHVGYCSQAAIFTAVAGKPGLQEAELVYKLVAEEVYPVDTRSPEERLANEVEYAVRQLSLLEDHQNPGDEKQALVPVHKVLTQFAMSKKPLWKTEEISDFLSKKYKLTDSGDHIVINLPQRSSSDSSCASFQNDDDLIVDDKNDDDDDDQEDFAVSDSELWG